MKNNNSTSEIKEIHFTYDAIDRDCPREVSEIASNAASLARLRTHPDEMIGKLEPLLQKYPKIPVLYNYMAAAQQALGNEDEAFALLEKCYKQFPDYVYGACSYVQMLNVKGNREAFAQVFDEKFDIDDAFPRTKIFHASEVIYFYGLQGMYRINKGEIDRATAILEMIKPLDASNDLVKNLEVRIALFNVIPTFEALIQGNSRSLPAGKRRMTKKRKGQ